MHYRLIKSQGFGVRIYPVIAAKSTGGYFGRSRGDVDFASLLRTKGVNTGDSPEHRGQRAGGGWGCGWQNAQHFSRSGQPQPHPISPLKTPLNEENDVSGKTEK